MLIEWLGCMDGWNLNFKSLSMTEMISDCRRLSLAYSIDVHSCSNPNAMCKSYPNPKHYLHYLHYVQRAWMNVSQSVNQMWCWNLLRIIIYISCLWTRQVHYSFGILFCTVLTEKCYILNAVFSLDIAILLFGISRRCFCHIYIVILISNFCYSSAVIFCFSFRGLYTPGGVSNLKGKVM